MDSGRRQRRSRDHARSGLPGARPLGRRILAAFVEVLAGAGLRRLQLEQAGGYNGRAIAAYLASGFAVSGEYCPRPTRNPGLDVESLLESPAAEAIARERSGSTWDARYRARIVRIQRRLSRQLKDPSTLTQPIDLIALDLDGTLLAADESISPASSTAIARALGNGIWVVLVPGRGVDTPWIKVQRQLGLNLPVICCHGALTKGSSSPTRPWCTCPCRSNMPRRCWSSPTAIAPDVAVFCQVAGHVYPQDRRVRPGAKCPRCSTRSRTARQCSPLLGDACG